MSARPRVCICCAALAGASLLACSNASTQQSCWNQRGAEPGLSAVAGTATLTWSDGSSVTYAVDSVPTSPATCQFALSGGQIVGRIGGEPVVSPNSGYLLCKDASPGYYGDFLFPGGGRQPDWKPLSEASIGDSFISTLPLGQRLYSTPTSSTECRDDNVTSSVSATVLAAAGTYHFADATVSPDYLRRVHLDIVAGPSVCGLVELMVSLTAEQGPDQLHFVDAVACSGLPE